MESQFSWLKCNGVEIGDLELSFAHGTVVVRFEPEHEAMLAELMTTNSENPDCEVCLTNDAHLRLIGF